MAHTCWILAKYHRKKNNNGCLKKKEKKETHLISISFFEACILFF